MEVDVKVFDNEDNYKFLLLDIESLLTNSIMSFKFITYKEKLSDLLQIANLSNSDFNRTNLYLLKEEIKFRIYNRLVQSYKHGAPQDLVNSELGLLNVLCINEDTPGRHKLLTQELIDSCILLLDKIQLSLSSIDENISNFLSEHSTMKFYVDQIHTILNDKENNFNSDHNKCETIKNNLSYVFNFISKYKE